MDMDSTLDMLGWSGSFSRDILGRIGLRYCIGYWVDSEHVWIRLVYGLLGLVEDMGP